MMLLVSFMSKCNFSSNLKLLRKRQKLSQEKLAAALGIKRVLLNAYENEHTKNPTVEIMMKASDYFKISLDVFMKVDLSQLDESKIIDLESRSDKDISGKGLRVIVTTVNSHNKANIEHVPIKAKAGYLAGYGDSSYINTLPVFSLPNLPDDKKYRSFPSEGDSMYPFPENSIIVGEYVDNWFLLKTDVPCIVVTKNEGIVFKLVTGKIQDKRELELKSLNLMYQPYRIAIDEVCEIWKYKCYISDIVPESTPFQGRIEDAIFQIQADMKRLLSK